MKEAPTPFSCHPEIHILFNLQLTSSLLWHYHNIFAHHLFSTTYTMYLIIISALSLTICTCSLFDHLITSTVMIYPITCFTLSSLPYFWLLMSKCRMPRSECRIMNVECRMPNSKYRVPSVELRGPSSKGWALRVDIQGWRSEGGDLRVEIRGLRFDGGSGFRFWGCV